MQKENQMNKGKLRLICQCGTIWPVCELPVAIDDMVEAINKASCPTCNKSSKTSAVYLEKADG